MKKLSFVVLPLFIVSFLFNCGGPTKYTLTLSLTDCNVNGASSYTHIYTSGEKMEPIVVSPNPGFVLANDSVGKNFKPYWKASTDGSYVMSNLLIDSDYTISIKGGYTVTIVTPGATITDFAIKNKDYKEIMTVTDADKVLPVSIDDIVLDDKKSTSIIDDCEYQLQFGRKTAEVKIPAKDITNNIKISLTLIDEESIWFNKLDWWNYCSNTVDNQQAMSADIGQEVEVNVNSLPHKVRLIGLDHDDLVSGNGKAHCTFEFVNLISDKNGYSLNTAWNWKDDFESTNYDYLNSNLRKAIDGGGEGTLEWYEKGNSVHSETYQQPVIEMLPEELHNVLKPVNKLIALYKSSDYVLESYKTQLFPLSYREMTASGTSPCAKEEGTPYEFYIDKGDTDSNRIKWQVMHQKGAVIEPTSITDHGNPTPDEGWHPKNYAGYNSNDKDTVGGFYWMRSPHVENRHSAYFTYDNGVLIGNSAFHGTYGVAPAFCI